MNKLATGEDAPAQRYMLLQADITSLPVADGCYDVAIAVHVLHLVDGWQQALLEARRVLRKPGGWLFIARNEHRDQDDTSAHRMVNRQWETILQDLGVDRASLRPGVTGASGKGPDEAIETYLHVLGAETERLVLVEHRELPVCAREMVQRHIDRLYSGDWLLPDDVHDEAARRLQGWLANSCPEPDRPVSAVAHFGVIAARW